MSSVIYHIGHEAGAFTELNSALYTTNPGFFNPSYSRCAIFAPGPDDLVCQLPNMVEHGTSLEYGFAASIKLDL
jgi:hypothetical protein